MANKIDKSSVVRMCLVGELDDIENLVDFLSMHLKFENGFVEYDHFVSAKCQDDNSDFFVARINIEGLLSFNGFPSIANYFQEVDKTREFKNQDN